MKHITLIIFVALFMGLGFVQPAYGADADVTTCNLTGTGSITAAVTAANSGGGVITYTLPCTTNFSNTAGLQITNNVTINTNGHAVVYNGSSGSRRFFRVSGSGSLTINGGVTFQNGSVIISTLGGGAIHNNGVLNLSNVTFHSNGTAVWGGGAIFNNGTATLNNVTFTSNRSNIAGGGGAIANTGTLIVTNSNFSGNQANIVGGGAIYNLVGNSTITGSTFSGNSGLGGGAITNIDSPMSISNSTFSGNTVSVSGGAVWNSFNGAMITGSTFSGNNALVSGGAVFNSNVVTISHSAFSGNSTSGYGGAVENFFTGTVNIINSTLSANNANSGGGISSGGMLNLTYVTLHGNMAGSGGSVYLYDGGANSTASIFSAGSCDGAIGDAGGNIHHDAAGCVGDAIDPLLGGLTGGVHIPLNNSIGHVPPCLEADDQLGNSRNDVSSCTAGAVQLPDDGEVVIPEVVVVVLPDPNALGCVVTTEVDINAPDNTYCRVLMRHGNVVGYSGAVPDSLIGLGVQFAVDVYRLEGGRAVIEFDNYTRICLSGAGRLFYLDARQSPRSIFELTTESLNGATCGWIPATGTLVLTN